MPTFTFRCGWCGSKDQTADVVAHHTHKYRDYRHNDVAEYRLALLCRRCKNFSTVTASSGYPIPSRFQQHNYSTGVSEELFKEKDDITDVFRDNFYQTPRVSLAVSQEIPQSVRECLLDAEEARSPRAQCQSYRTALEFALREANIAISPGKTLGAILVEAQKNFALPDALIELCDQVKAFGNWGLHWAETKIEKDDAAAAKMIAKAVLDYLFVLPAEVTKAKARTDEAKGNHTTGVTKGTKKQ